MNEQEIKRIAPRASKSFIDLNRGPSGAQSQPTVLNRTNGKTAREEKDTRRYAVCVTAYRARQCDPDNLCAKYFIDSLRYAGVIYDDRQIDLEYSIRQKKATSKKEEKTLIQVTEL